MLTEDAISKQLEAEINEGGGDKAFLIDYSAKAIMWHDPDGPQYCVNHYRIEGDKVILDAMPSMAFPA